MTPTASRGERPQLQRHSMALLMVDVINAMEFEGGESLLRHALPAARRLAALKRRAKHVGIPVIYVNDNFGHWQSDLNRLVEDFQQPEVRGHAVVSLLKPEDDDYSVLKPKHSGFYLTPLEVLLENLRVDTVIIAGFATNICVLFTANDAYMRGYDVVVPSDCVASEGQEENAYALKQMGVVLKADIVRSDRLDLNRAREPQSPGTGEGSVAENLVGSGVSMDILDLLHDEHESVQKVLTDLADTTQRARVTREEPFAKVKQDLQGHMRGEEQVVYPALDKDKESHIHVLEAFEEHRLVKMLLEELSGLDVQDEKWGPKIKVVKDLVEHHVEEEEGPLFAQARENLSAEARRQLTDSYKQAKTGS